MLSNFRSYILLVA